MKAKRSLKGRLQTEEKRRKRSKMKIQNNRGGLMRRSPKKGKGEERISLSNCWKSEPLRKNYRGSSEGRRKNRWLICQRRDWHLMDWRWRKRRKRNFVTFESSITVLTTSQTCVVLVLSYPPLSHQPPDYPFLTPIEHIQCVCLSWLLNSFSISLVAECIRQNILPNLWFKSLPAFLTLKVYNETELWWWRGTWFQSWNQLIILLEKSKYFERPVKAN